MAWAARCALMCVQKSTHTQLREESYAQYHSHKYIVYTNIYATTYINQDRQCDRHTTKKAINEESSTQEERGFAKPLSTVQFLHAVDPWVERADVRPFVGRGPGSIAASAPERV